MRENKFRASDKFNEDMFYSGERLSEFFQQVERLIKGGNHVEVTQYTGLKDYRGVEIYEGDIIKNMKVVEEIVFNKKSAAFQMGNGYHLRQIDLAYEVIGNIYENPKLLEESK